MTFSLPIIARTFLAMLLLLSFSQHSYSNATKEQEIVAYDQATWQCIPGKTSPGLSLPRENEPLPDWLIEHNLHHCSLSNCLVPRYEKGFTLLTTPEEFNELCLVVNNFAKMAFEAANILRLSLYFERLSPSPLETHIHKLAPYLAETYVTRAKELIPSISSLSLSFAMNDLISSKLINYDEELKTVLAQELLQHIEQSNSPVNLVNMIMINSFQIFEATQQAKLMTTLIKKIESFGAPQGNQEKTEKNEL